MLWNFLTRDPNGLYATIQLLKDVRIMEDFERIRDVVKICLENLLRISQEVEAIHPFIDNEWEVGGYREGKALYKLKKIDASARVFAGAGTGSLPFFDFNTLRLAPEYDRRAFAKDCGGSLNTL